MPRAPGFPEPAVIEKDWFVQSAKRKRALPLGWRAFNISDFLVSDSASEEETRGGGGACGIGRARRRRWRGSRTGIFSAPYGTSEACLAMELRIARRSLGGGERKRDGGGDDAVTREAFRDRPPRVSRRGRPHARGAADPRGGDVSGACGSRRARPRRDTRAKRVKRVSESEASFASNGSDASSARDDGAETEARAWNEKTKKTSLVGFARRAPGRRSGSTAAGHARGRGDVQAPSRKPRSGLLFRARVGDARAIARDRPRRRRCARRRGDDLEP